MSFLTRAAGRSARQSGLAATRTTRRWVSNHSSTEHAHHHAAPADEPLGTGFFVILFTIPGAIAVYSISRPAKDGTNPGLTQRIFDGIQGYKQRWADRNDFHTRAVEQIGNDRALFFHAKPSTHYELKFPETFNTGSPFNRVAGHSGGNLDQLVAHYHQKNVEAEERRIQKMAEKQASQ